MACENAHRAHEWFDARRVAHPTVSVSSAGLPVTPLDVYGLGHTEDEPVSENANKPDERDNPENDEDVEGHNMLMYEQARVLQREREREVQRHARDARLIEERKNQKR